MTQPAIIKEAQHLITDLEKACQLSRPTDRDYLRLQEAIANTLASLNKLSKVNNTTYITLEKFYQTASLIIGLSNINLSEPAYQAWRAYDRFHFEQVKPKLKVYGNTVLW